MPRVLRLLGSAYKAKVGGGDLVGDNAPKYAWDIASCLHHPSSPSPVLSEIVSFELNFGLLLAMSQAGHKLSAEYFIFNVFPALAAD